MTDIHTGAVAPPAASEMRLPPRDSKEHARRATRRPVSGGPAFGATVAVTDLLANQPVPAIVRASSRDADGNTVLDLTVFKQHASEVHKNVRWCGNEKAAQEYLAEETLRADSDPSVSEPTRYVAFPV